MCKWSGVRLTASKCRNNPIHEFDELTYELCKYARGNQLCDNVTSKEGQEGLDIGSCRNKPCPVCRTIDDADSKLRAAEWAYETAKQTYNNDIASASRIVRYIPVGLIVRDTPLKTLIYISNTVNTVGIDLCDV